MARNVEIKARLRSIDALLPLARQLAGGAEPERIEQDDSFFHSTKGRLKLREFAAGHGELIYYERADASGPKTSHYLIVPVPQPQPLRQVLAAACGLRGRVRKTRWLFLLGRTRVHLDRVDGLGDFLELEVVLADGEDEAAGRAEARAWMQRLGVPPADLVQGAYLDLLSNS